MMCTILVAHTSALESENFPRYFSIPKNYCNSFLLKGGGISVSTCSFLGSSSTQHLDIISPKGGLLVHSKWYLFLFYFLMSSAIPNTFVKSLKISSIFCWNISPAGATPNGSLVDLSLSN